MSATKQDRTVSARRPKKPQNKAKAGVHNKEVPRSSSRASLVDKLNQEIVRKLQEDGRRPYKEIAEALSVSEGTIRNRVNWMRDAGMLQIAAIADPSSLSYKTDSILGVKVASTSTPKEVAERLAVHPEVVFILWVTGRYDLIVEIVSDAEDILCDFLAKHCFGQSDISGIEVMKGLAMYKNQFLLKRRGVL